MIYVGHWVYSWGYHWGGRLLWVLSVGRDEGVELSAMGRLGRNYLKGRSGLKVWCEGIESLPFIRWPIKSQELLEKFSYQKFSHEWITSWFNKTTTSICWEECNIYKRAIYPWIAQLRFWTSRMNTHDWTESSHVNCGYF